MGHDYCEKRPVLAYVLSICNEAKTYRKYETKNITWFSNDDYLQNYGQKIWKEWALWTLKTWKSLLEF